MQGVTHPAVILVQVTDRQARVRFTTAESAEGIAEQKSEQNRHDEQEHESLEIARQLHQVFDGNVEDADHSVLLYGGRVAPSASRGAYRDHHLSSNLLFGGYSLVSIWRTSTAYSTNGFLLEQYFLSTHSAG